MLVNPIFLIVSAALILLCLLFCLINRPHKPIMTLSLMVLLIVYLLCTAILNNVLTPSTEYLISSERWNRVASYLMAVKHPTQEQYEGAFRIFQKIDIGLFIAAAGSMVIEVWNIVIKPNAEK